MLAYDADDRLVTTPKRPVRLPDSELLIMPYRIPKQSADDTPCCRCSTKRRHGLTSLDLELAKRRRTSTGPRCYACGSAPPTLCISYSTPMVTALFFRGAAEVITPPSGAFNIPPQAPVEGVGNIGVLSRSP